MVADPRARRRRVPGRADHPVPAGRWRQSPARKDSGPADRRRRASWPASPWPRWRRWRWAPSLGPEAPLIALGGGLAAFAVRLRQARRRRRRPWRWRPQRELRGYQRAARLPPARGLPPDGGGRAGRRDDSASSSCPACCAGIGALVFIGLDSLTGLGHAVSLTLTGCRRSAGPTSRSSAGPSSSGSRRHSSGSGIRRTRPRAAARVERRRMLATAPDRLLVARVGLRSRTPPDRQVPRTCCSPGRSRSTRWWPDSAGYSRRRPCWSSCSARAVAYGLALSSFRGGPVFPAMFLGAAGASPLAQLPGLQTVRVRDGHRRHVRRDAGLPAGLGAAGHAAVDADGLDRHPAGDRRRRRRLRRPRLAVPATDRDSGRPRTAPDPAARCWLPWRRARAPWRPP